MPFALVTGGGSGIGRAFCEQLAAEGFEVAVVDVNQAGAEETVRTLEARGGRALALAADVSLTDDWRRLHDTLRQRWPRIDLVVNNAGILLCGELAECDSAACRRLIEVNLLGVLEGCRTFAPWLIESQRAAPGVVGVINISSIFGVISPPMFAPYNAAKAGVLALSESLHGELAPHGVRVTVALPGATLTQLFAAGQYVAASLSAGVNRYLAKAELAPADVARTALAVFRRGKLYAPVGLRAKLYWRLRRMAPLATLKLVAKKTVQALRT